MPASAVIGVHGAGEGLLHQRAAMEELVGVEQQCRAVLPRLAHDLLEEPEPLSQVGGQ